LPRNCKGSVYHSFLEVYPMKKFKRIVSRINADGFIADAQDDF